MRDMTKTYSDKQYALCETYSQPPSLPWHIRKLDSRGLLPGGISGGAASLCGREIAWDLSVELTKHHISHACVTCVERYKTVIG